MSRPLVVKKCGVIIKAEVTPPTEKQEAEFNESIGIARDEAVMLNLYNKRVLELKRSEREREVKLKAKAIDFINSRAFRGRNGKKALPSIEHLFRVLPNDVASEVVKLLKLRGQL